MDWDKKWFQFTILFMLAFTWGSSFILMKIGLKSFSNDQAAAIRMALASLALLPLSIKHVKKLTKKDFPYLMIAGFIGSFIPAFLFTKAQTRLDSALAGMLNSMTPIFTLIVGALFFKGKFKLRQVIGLILGLIGAMGLISAGQSISIHNINSYAFFIVVATMCYAFNINVVRTYLSHLNGIVITALSFMFIWPVALGYLFTTDLQAVTVNPDWQLHLLALAGLGIIGTATAMLFMNSLIRHSSAVFASSVTYIIPIFAIFWGLLDGENITFMHVICMAIVLVGVYLINRKRN
jgi:drug/metabolite transporter (DMT)-like permease